MSSRGGLPTRDLAVVTRFYSQIPRSLRLPRDDMSVKHAHSIRALRRVRRLRGRSLGSLPEPHRVASPRNVTSTTTGRWSDPRPTPVSHFVAPKCWLTYTWLMRMPGTLYRNGPFTGHVAPRP